MNIMWRIVPDITRIGSTTYGKWKAQRIELTADGIVDVCLNILVDHKIFDSMTDTVCTEVIRNGYNSDEDDWEKRYTCEYILTWWGNIGGKWKVQFIGIDLREGRFHYVGCYDKPDELKRSCDPFD